MPRRPAHLLLWLALAAPALADAPEKARVDAAVARGVAWLKQEQKANGVFGSGPGETALALLALRHSGVLADDRVCVKAEKQLVRSLPDGTVYGAALGILALLEQDIATHRKEIEKLVEQLVGGQCRNGQWSYAYRRTAKKKAGDNSNTQIAILALRAARVRRFKVPDETFARAHAFFAGSQNEDGGFGYADNQRTRSYGSMTAGGAMALAVCMPHRPGERKKSTPELEAALAWLGQRFDPAKNRDAGKAFGKKKGKRGDNFWKHYWIWSLERACSAANVNRLGPHDWYARGAEHLLEKQSDDGAWKNPERALLATSFALLFFARSTRRSLTARPGEVAVTPSGG